jgi:hypothetical protein
LTVPPRELLHMTINLHRDDAARFLMTVLRERPENVRSNGNDVWIPKVAEEYLREISDKPIAVNDSTTLDFYPLFHDAAWDLARRGVLRLSEIYPTYRWDHVLAEELDIV